MSPTPPYSVHDVARLTGIEESRIRFLELAFHDFLGFESSHPTGRYFEERHVTLLRDINQLMLEGRLGVAQARHALSSQITNYRKSLKIIAVTSGKGGVGKTTVAVNLAICLQWQGKRVMVFDADLGLANVHVVAGISPQGTVMDVVAGRAALRDVLTDGPEGVKFLCAGSGVAEMADLGNTAMEFLGREIEQMAGLLDVIIVDTAAGISSNVMRFLSLADEIVVVSTPNIASILDAYGVIKVSRLSENRGRTHVLVNMADSLQDAVAVYNNVRSCARRFLQYSPEYLGHLVRDRTVEDANQLRQPFVLCYPQTPNARLIDAVAQKLMKAGAEEAPVERDLCSLFVQDAAPEGAQEGAGASASAEPTRET